MHRKLVLRDIRDAIDAVRGEYLDFNSRRFQQMSDEEFMTCHFAHDLGMDSMDFEDFCCQLEANCLVDIDVNIRDHFNDDPHQSGLTVAAFLQTCNRART